MRPITVLHKAGTVQIHPDAGIAGATAQRRGLPVHKMTLAANGKGYDLPARGVGVNVQSGQQCLQLVSSQSGAYRTALDTASHAVQCLPVHTIQQGRPFHVAISVRAVLVPAFETRRTGRQRYSFRKAGSDRIARIRIAVLVLLDDGTCQRAVVTACGQCFQVARAAIRAIGCFSLRVSITVIAGQVNGAVQIIVAVLAVVQLSGTPWDSGCVGKGYGIILRHSFVAVSGFDCNSSGALIRGIEPIVRLALVEIRTFIQHDAAGAMLCGNFAIDNLGIVIRQDAQL